MRRDGWHWLWVIPVALLVGSSFYMMAEATPPDTPCQRQGECRKDPQTDRGKDCEQHGKNPGGNQDHCGPAVGPTPDISVPPPDDTLGPRLPADGRDDDNLGGRDRGSDVVGGLRELPRTGITEAIAVVGGALILYGALVRLAEAIVMHAAIQTQQAQVQRKRRKS